MVAAVAASALTAAVTPGSAQSIVPVARHSSVPPECVRATIVENSGNGPVLYTEWCGTGSAGESPMDGKLMVVDGSGMSPASCRQTAPCVVLWPGSPPS